MISPLAYLLWFLEWSLEVFGAYQAFRYRCKLPLLFALLGLASVSDIVTFCLYHFGTPPLHIVYAWAYWGDKMGHWLILCFLGCQVCGQFMGDHAKRAVSAAISICMLAALLSPLIISETETLKNKLLDGAIAADAVLLLLMLLGFLARKQKLDFQWKWIALGIAVQIGWDLLCSFVWGYWDGAKHFVAIGEIAALLMWNWAVRSKQSEFRLPLRANREMLPESPGYPMSSLRLGNGVRVEDVEQVKGAAE